MKKLTLTNIFAEKLNRLHIKVGELSYAGADLDSYAGKPIVAIVGTRKPTPYGKQMTEKFAESLARAGVVVVSGLAMGIDGIAHSATLKVDGLTIAVLPSGLSAVYPASNRPIADTILRKNGTLISEYEPDRMPRKIEFLERNRIIAALSDIVLIPEAAANSGSLNTANHARHMQIPVCVIPGNVTSPMSVGTNHLLKTGAVAVTEPADLLELLHIADKHVQMELNLIGGTPAETLLLQKLSHGITQAHELQAETLLDTTLFQTSMSMLEIQGRITADELGNWRLN